MVPLGVDHAPASSEAIAAVRQRHSLPERFVLFVGTLEPRKNLRRLAAANEPMAMPLVVAGPQVGVMPPRTSPATFDSSASCRGPTSRRCTRRRRSSPIPSESEGFGLPVLEAMTQGAPVVTSAGTSTEEVAGGAAVLVDPFDVDSIAAGLGEAERRADELSAAARARAADDDVGRRGARANARVYRRGCRCRGG